MIGGQPGILVETSTQFGANTLDVTRALEARLDALVPSLKLQGVDYHPALLRPASFIEAAIEKLRNSLLIGAVLVVALLLVTLRDWRGALVSFSSIPLALLTTVWILETFGLSLNTMTLGGLVVALGVVVDDAVIDVENILRRMRSAGSNLDVRDLFTRASLEVRRPVFYATAAVAVAFLPILMMSGLQGAFFPSAVDRVPARDRSFAAGRDERDTGVVRAGDEESPTASGGFVSRALQALATARDQWLRPAPARADRAAHRERHRRRRAAAAARRASPAGFPRKLSDRARIAPSGHRTRRDRAHRRGHLQRRWPGFRASRASPSRSAAPRTARIRTCRTRASSRCRSIRRKATRPRTSTPQSEMCSTTIRTSSSKSTRCSPSASAKRCPAKARRFRSAYSAPISISTTRSPAKSPMRCGNCATAEPCDWSCRRASRSFAFH